MGEQEEQETKKEEMDMSRVSQTFYELRESDKLEALCRLIDVEEDFYGLVFCRTKRDVDMINENHRGMVLIGGSFINYNTFQHAKKMGVSGIVTGGFDYTDLSLILGYSLGVAITGSEKIGPSLIITEGFGKISIANRTYELLSKMESPSNTICFMRFLLIFISLY